MPDIEGFFRLECKKHKVRYHDKRNNDNIKRTIYTDKRINTSLKDRKSVLNNHGSHGLISFLSFLTISV